MTQLPEFLAPLPVTMTHRTPPSVSLCVALLQLTSTRSQLSYLVSPFLSRLTRKITISFRKVVWSRILSPGVCHAALRDQPVPNGCSWKRLQDAVACKACFGDWRRLYYGVGEASWCMPPRRCPEPASHPANHPPRQRWTVRAVPATAGRAAPRPRDCLCERCRHQDVPACDLLIVQHVEMNRAGCIRPAGVRHCRVSLPPAMHCVKGALSAALGGGGANMRRSSRTHAR